MPHGDHNVRPPPRWVRATIDANFSQRQSTCWYASVLRTVVMPRLSSGVLLPFSTEGTVCCVSHVSFITNYCCLPLYARCTLGAEAPGEPSNSLGMMEDADIKNAVEDFDASNWTLDQLGVSCQTLLEECYASEDRRRRILSAGMLVKLIDTYPTANRYAELVSSSIVGA